MKKKIVIVTHKMVMGGIEKSLISLINSINRDLYDVSIFLMENGGELINEVPKWIEIKLIPSINESIIKRIKLNLNYKKLSKALSILYYTILTKLTKKSYKGSYYYPKIINNVDDEFDLAIAYHTPLGFPVGYVIDNLNAKKKIAYIHGDMDQYKDIEDFNIILGMYKKYYEKYDKIFCVSKDAKKKFINHYPDLENKTDLFYNILDHKEIYNKSLAKDGFKDDFDGIRIVTVGRISSEKGQLIIPKLVKRLVDEGIKIKWYCIGNGNLIKDLEKLKIELDIRDELILLGTQNNPYPFIKQSDIYVQTSLYEAYCITLAEAKILNKPIVTTNFVGAQEQIINGKNGLIVNYDEDELYEAIKKLIKDDKLRKAFEINLQDNSIDYKKQINKLYQLMY